VPPFQSGCREIVLQFRDEFNPRFPDTALFCGLVPTLGKVRSPRAVRKCRRALMHENSKSGAATIRRKPQSQLRQGRNLVEVDTNAAYRYTQR
jgi:hypothetical protein